MQAWIIPGAPRRDGWHIWYATDGAAPTPVTVTSGGRVIDTVWELRGPFTVQGFNRTIFLASVKLVTTDYRSDYQIFTPETADHHRWNLLPETLPAEGISFVIGSCFWQQDDAEGELLKATLDILKLEQPRPLFKLLMGDQIYLDWPPDVSPWRLRLGGYALVGDRYRRYWGDDAYRQFLAMLPNLTIPDDHEFWNDFPESQIQLPITWMPRLRDEFASAARDYFDLFQGLLNPRKSGQAWTVLSLPPASLFIADTRSERSLHNSPQPCLMSEAQWKALEHWQQTLNGPGLLALGQPMFQCDGDWRDHSLSNFVDDYRRLLSIIRRSALGDNQAGIPPNIVLLSGDIHNARAAFATIPDVDNPDFNRVHELVASASSAIGPYLSTPKPSSLPAFLPEGHADRDYSSRWPVHKVDRTVPFDAAVTDKPYASVDNNIGVIRLKPATVAPYSLELNHVSYRVRPYRKPYLARSSPLRHASRVMYSQTLNLR